MSKQAKQTNKPVATLNPYARQAILNAGYDDEQCDLKLTLIANKKVKGPGWYYFYTGRGSWEFRECGKLTKREINRYRREERDIMGDDCDIDPNCINNNDESCLVYVQAV